MSVAFITRSPSAEELDRLRLVLSTFRDGSGMLIEDGASLPGWRDYERSVAAVLNGSALESKAVFDVFVPSTEQAAVDYGLSLKSKALPVRQFRSLAGTGRVYMELSNSPAKLWEAVQRAGASEADFRAQQKADVIGEALLDAVRSWHSEAAALHPTTYGRTLDLGRSVYLVISNAPCGTTGGGLPCREYQWHAFDLAFPQGITWSYRSGRSLKGNDPRHPDECIFDWYPFSGGQLKYYPRAQYARYNSPVFQLAVPPPVSVLEKAARYWPDEWKAVGGTTSATQATLAAELQVLAKLMEGTDACAILERAANDLLRAR